MGVEREVVVICVRWSTLWHPNIFHPNNIERVYPVRVTGWFSADGQGAVDALCISSFPLVDCEKRNILSGLYCSRFHLTVAVSILFT